MKPYRSSNYLKWIRTLGCVVCGSTRNIEAAHTGPHGLGQKSSDFTAIPLCVAHHRLGDHCYHKLGPRKFADVHHLNIRETVSLLNSRPRIRIVAGLFVGRYREEQYVLGTTQAGVQEAVRKMIAIKRVSTEELLQRRHHTSGRVH
jgi:hypothetical protein